MRLTKTVPTAFTSLIDAFVAIPMWCNCCYEGKKIVSQTCKHIDSVPSTTKLLVLQHEFLPPSNEVSSKFRKPKCNGRDWKTNELWKNGKTNNLQILSSHKHVSIQEGFNKSILPTRVSFLIPVPQEVVLRSVLESQDYIQAWCFLFCLILSYTLNLSKCLDM